jgi:G3E family GTPase
MTDRLPVVLVTGFLGSGKTTLISALLAHPGMGETAVLVNELGEAAIDHHLVRQVDERTVVMGSGCICCTLRGDLRDELRDLLARRARGELGPFRRVVVETTGLADPAPVLSTLLADPVLRHHVAVEAVVTTVDAVNGAVTLDRQPESVKQAAVADTLLVTKADAAAPAVVAALEARLRALNPIAPIRRVAFGAIAPDDLLRARARELPAAVLAREHDHSRHADDVRAFTLVLDEPLDWDAFAVWLTMLLHSRGLDVLRVKGLLDVGEPGPVVLDGVQHVVHRPRHLDAWPDDDHRSRIVFITRGIERAAVLASLEAFAGLGRSVALSG